MSTFHNPWLMKRIQNISGSVKQVEGLHCTAYSPGTVQRFICGFAQGFTHPEREAEWSVVRLEAHWSPLLEDGLVSRMQPLPYSRGGVIVVVMVTGGRVVVIVVDRLVGIIVFLLPQKIGVEVSVQAERRERIQEITVTDLG